MQTPDENDQGEGTSHLRSLGALQDAQRNIRTADGATRNTTRNTNRNSSPRDRSGTGHEERDQATTICESDCQNEEIKKAPERGLTQNHSRIDDPHHNHKSDKSPLRQL